MRRKISRVPFRYFGSTRLKSGPVFYCGIFLFWESAIEKGVANHDSLKQGLIFYSILSKTVRISAWNGRARARRVKKFCEVTHSQSIKAPPQKTKQKGGHSSGRREHQASNDKQSKFTFILS